MADIRRVRVTGRAAKFVALLQEYGHLDDEGAEDVLVDVAEFLGTPKGRKVDLADVRRFAASALFDTEGGDAGPAALSEDWPLLFS